MPTEVILPRVDMDMTTGKISRWYVDEGAKVEKGTALFEIETDKAAMEIDAPATGVLRDIAAIGEDLPVGATVGWIYSAGEAERPDKPKPGETSAIAETAPPKPAIVDTAEPKPATPDVLPPEEAQGRPRATPLARRLARQNGIELELIPGSGPRGRIQSGDVLQRLATVKPAPTLAPLAAGLLHHAWLREGEGTPSLLIHGFGAELGSWRPFLSGLAAPPPILAVDLPGHGRSPLAGAADLDAFAAAVEDLLASQGLSRLHVVGHSLGGAVATMLAARGRADVASLMLISSAGLGPDIDGAFLSGFLRARGEASLSPWMRRLVHDEASLPAGFVGQTLRSRDEAMVSAQERVVGSLFPDGTQAIATRALFDHLAMPVKLVFGADDAVIPARHAAGLPGKIALHLFQATGHLPHIERAPAVRTLWQELMRSAV